MTTYQINDLERITGIKAHTIRIWEKRYGLITPDRTATNRRHYSDNQLRKLLNVTTLLAKGQKISKIASLSESELYAQIENGVLDETNDSINTALINDLIKSMHAFDETAFEKTFSAAVTRFGMYGATVNVIYPFLGKTGMLWSIAKTAPAQEHFASNIIRRKLSAAIDGLLPPHLTSKKFLLFLPPGELHEIGLLFANYLIRSKGYETIYLGQNVPFDNISTIVPIVRPDHMLCFYITTIPKEEVAAQIANYACIDTKVQLLIAGNISLLPDGKSVHRNVSYLKNVNSLLALL